MLTPLLLVFVAVGSACGGESPGDVDTGPVGDAGPVGDGATDSDAARPPAPVIPDLACWPDPASTAISEPNPSARADAFKAFYRERSSRVLVSVNRFALGGDASAANFFGRSAVARSGDNYEVILGPDNNMPMCMSLFATYKLYQALGGRDFELSLIRMLRGAAFNEAVSGHPGLTTREALPGWTRVTDGVADTVTRTRLGTPLDPPVAPPPGLEQEILDSFYEGVRFTYRENPEDFFFRFMPLHDTGSFSATYVFSELDGSPAFIRQSDCCSSFVRSERGPWAGAWWGNHNSRDNFTDVAMGFLAAMDIRRMACVPTDLRNAAQSAVDAARRTGDSIVAHGNVLMTVDEWHDYNTLSPAGQRNPDGEEEPQDLGSLNSCAMIYLAHAISSGGLRSPVPETPLAGASDLAGFGLILTSLGFPSDGTPNSCSSIDEAFGGVSWADISGPMIHGVLDMFGPDMLLGIIDTTMDDFAEMLIGPVALASYARMTEDAALYDEAIANLRHLLRFQGVVEEIVRDDGDPNRIARLEQMQYMGGVYTRMFALDSPLSIVAGFGRGEEHTRALEAPLALADTASAPLIGDGEIQARVEAHLFSITERAPWRVERYRDRFGSTPPVRRAGAGYEAVQADGTWGAVENPHHTVFNLGPFDLWFEAALCIDSPQTLDCTWARLGCTHVDLDDNGGVNGADIARFDTLRGGFPDGTECSEGNGWCDRADLDQSGAIDSDDRAFLDAAQGCIP
ncbi:MAG: hypothetical protein JRH11_09085 [Deltaproteobacteria bacterium]|nr:hypothetical protein [Deltaproteobacteria bacterium]